jgi:hypothetical protein
MGIPLLIVAHIVVILSVLLVVDLLPTVHLANLIINFHLILASPAKMENI